MTGDEERWDSEYEIINPKNNVQSNPRCEVCGTRNYMEEELLHLMDFDDYHPGEFEGMEACPDCVFEIYSMHRNPITKKPITFRQTAPD